MTTYVYDEKRWDETLELVDETAPYALTGAVFATERAAIDEAQDALRYAAGNFYVNDKPTGAVVGQQPFGGSRASGTNDKAGSMWNLIRWVSPRTIKETFVPPTDYRYPFLGPDGDRRQQLRRARHVARILDGIDAFLDQLAAIDSAARVHRDPLPARQAHLHEPGLEEHPRRRVSRPRGSPALDPRRVRLGHRDQRDHPGASGRRGARGPRAPRDPGLELHDGHLEHARPLDLRHRGRFERS